MVAFFYEQNAYFCSMANFLWNQKFQAEQKSTKKPRPLTFLQNFDIHKGYTLDFFIFGVRMTFPTTFLSSFHTRL